MKNKTDGVGFVDVLKFVALAVSGLLVLSQAANADGLTPNGGFELSESFRSDAVNTSYDKLVERDVRFPADSEPMPKFVVINPHEGWRDSGFSFEYAQGAPGAEVHSGSRAIRVISPRTFSGIMLGSVIPVVGQGQSTAGAVQIGKPCKYSFYAKGVGEVRVRFYMFESMSFLRTLHDYKTLQTLEPERHAIKNTNGWQLYSGTVMINSLDVGAVRLSIAFEGDVFIDEFKISN